jgi:hypothetical protein
MGLLNAALGEINLSAMSLVRNAIRKNKQTWGFWRVSISPIMSSSGIKRKD